MFSPETLLAWISSGKTHLSSSGRRNAVWSVTLKARRADDWACLGDAAVVVEVRPEGGPEWG
jgi:hypothetical protein